MKWFSRKKTVDESANKSISEMALDLVTNQAIDKRVRIETYVAGYVYWHAQVLVDGRTVADTRGLIANTEGGAILNLEYALQERLRARPSEVKIKQMAREITGI